jgi:acetyltransferase-like isoleucine patch superfamily enzyme
MYAADALLDGLMATDQRPEKIVIDDCVWIGTSVVVLKGVTIGRGAAIGAGAVVSESIPPYTVAAGVPARVLRPRLPEPVVEIVDLGEPVFGDQTPSHTID